MLPRGYRTGMKSRGYWRLQVALKRVLIDLLADVY